eukprot:1130041-Karenia_brevis.AAC.1
MPIIVQEFNRLGFHVNWKPGKTEAFLILRRSGAKQVRERLLPEKATSIPFCIDGDRITLQVVGSYRHLGTMQTDDAHAAADVPARIQ